MKNESIMGPIILLPKQMDQFVIKVNSTSHAISKFLRELWKVLWN